MDTFGAIQFETYHGCNLNCPTCPNSVIKKHGELMPWGIIKELIRQLKAADFGGRISPYLMNEPTCDQRLPEIIEYIRQEMPKNKIMIGTNGIAIEPQYIVNLFKRGLTDVVLTTYNEATWHKFKDMESGRFRILQIHDKNREHYFYNRGGNVKVGEDHEVVHETCSKGIKQAFVNYKGDVILCCADYYYQVVYGNMMNGDIMDIFNCDKAKHYREKLKNRDRRGLLLCEKCNVNRRQVREKRDTI